MIFVTFILQIHNIFVTNSQFFMYYLLGFLVITHKNLYYLQKWRE